MIHYINGNFVEEGEAVLSVRDLGMLRGYGTFDYIPIYQGCSFHLEEHLKRFAAGAHQLGLTLPLSLEALAHLFEELISRNGPPINAGIRCILTGGESVDSIHITAPPSLLLLFAPFSGNPAYYYTRGLRALTTQVLRPFPSFKLLNYLPAVWAMQQATQAGCDEALYITSHHELLEATTSNLFFVKEGCLITTDCDRIVKGVTRRIVLEIAAMPIELRPLHLDELPFCQEAFLTASKKDLIPLVEINGHPIGTGTPGPITHHLRSLFHTHRQKSLEAQVNNKLCSRVVPVLETK